MAGLSIPSAPDRNVGARDEKNPRTAKDATAANEATANAGRTACAMAGRRMCHQVVPTGCRAAVHLPGIYIDRVVPLSPAQAADKGIERRTVRRRREASA